MLSLEDIQGFVYELGIAEAGRVYIGKLDNKKEKSIGIYNRRATGPPIMALGGYDCRNLRMWERMMMGCMSMLSGQILFIKKISRERMCKDERNRISGT